MGHLLQLGAGFSRNWGGWLVSEAFQYLLGCPEICASEVLRCLLWRHQVTGGFEMPSPNCTAKPVVTGCPAS